MNKSKLFTALTLAAFVGVTACETQDDTWDDGTTTDPAVEQPVTTPETDDTWDDDATWDDDTTLDDTLRHEDDRDDDGVADNY